ncbi:hypothetical protein HNQ93_001640 [Hymenobacter luteus]|uniref:Lipoprotein n=2 Tax=Hymenobacter TaxID=89966 RepID=A0A7W9WAI4_9BACT|nr:MULTISPECIES: hypothetical protein [Hymenobacter]MBB4600999.1 hypothetical protein [Hymenobacter latericoloratus]MBB6058794.1 hypothetical protein [Hymenobacter luteus]
MRIACLFYSGVLITALGLGSCKDPKEQEPAPAPNTVSYKLNGVKRAGTARATRTPITITDQSGSYAGERLTLRFTCAYGSKGLKTEYVTISFMKAATAPDDDFRVMFTPAIDLAADGGTVNYVTNTRLHVRKISTGGFSGTFSGELPAATGRPASAFTEGVFTDVHP